jgi:hypothetical protein
LILNLPRSRSGNQKSKIGNQKSKILVVTRDRLNGGDHFFVGHFICGTDEARVAAVHQDGPVVFSIASQRSDQLPSFRVVEWTEIHRRSPFQKRDTKAGQSFCAASSQAAGKPLGQRESPSDLPTEARYHATSSTVLLLVKQNPQGSMARFGQRDRNS